MTAYAPTWRYRKLSPAQVQRIAAALANGVPATVLAPEYGVSVRTVHRAREQAAQAWVEVTVGEWRAQFLLTGDGPVRVTPWWAREDGA